MSCKAFQDKLNAYLDSELDPGTRAMMIEHANVCPVCGERLETMTRLLTMCAELDEGLSVPLDCQSAWRKAVRNEASANKAKRSGAHRLRTAVGAIAAALALLAGGTVVYRLSDTLPLNGGVNGVRIAPQAAVESARGKGAYYGQTALTNDTAGAVYMSADGAADDAAVSAAGAEAANDGQKAGTYLLRGASRTLTSDSFDRSMQSVEDLVDEYGGYFEQSSVSGQALQPGQSKGRTASMTVRIPSAQLDEFLIALDAAGTVTYKSETSEDVTENYYDAASRLASHRAQLDRLNELTKTAAGLEELLLLEDKVYEVQREIEALEGQLKSLSNKADYATVAIELIETEEGGAQAASTGDLKDRVQKAFGESLVWLNGFLQDAAVVLAMAAPKLLLAIPAILLIWLIVAGAKRRRKKRGGNG